MIGPMEILIMLGTIAPALALWIAVIVFAAIMLRRGGGRAERFMITGAGLKIISNLLGIPVAFIPIWLVDRGYSTDSAVSIASNCSIFINVIGMAGIICLVYAFWVKFRERNVEGVPKEASNPLLSDEGEKG
jgi:uncharacterized membrane protein